jgi:hypothetical protein
MQEWLTPTKAQKQKQISKEIGIGFGVVVTGIAMIFTPLAYAIVSGLVSGTGASMVVTAVQPGVVDMSEVIAVNGITAFSVIILIGFFTFLLMYLFTKFFPDGGKGGNARRNTSGDPKPGGGKGTAADTQVDLDVYNATQKVGSERSKRAGVENKEVNSKVGTLNQTGNQSSKPAGSRFVIPIKAPAKWFSPWS